MVAPPAVDALVVAARVVKIPCSPTRALSSSYWVALVSWYSSTSTWRSVRRHFSLQPPRAAAAASAAGRSGRRSPPPSRPPGAPRRASSPGRRRARRRPARRPGLLAAQAVVLPQADGPLPAPRHRRVGGPAGVPSARPARRRRPGSENFGFRACRASRRPAQHAHAQEWKVGDHQILRRPAPTRERAPARAFPCAALLVKVIAPIWFLARARLAAAGRSCG